MEQTVTADIGELKILFLSDLRFGQPIFGLNPEDVKERKQSEKDNLSRLLQEAKEEKVRYVAICGNLFCRDTFTGGDADFLITLMREHKDLTFLIAPGQEDTVDGVPFYATGRLPDNVHVFKDPGLSRFDFSDAAFYGFPAENTGVSEEIGGERKEADGTAEGEDKMLSLFDGKTAASDGRLQVLMGYLPSPSAKTAATIRSFAADITVLGGGTLAKKTILSQSPLMVVPGFAEGKKPSETGFGTVLLLTAIPGSHAPKLSLTEKVYARHQYLSLSLDVTGATEVNSVREKIADAVRSRGFGPETYLSLTLTGILPASLTLSQDFGNFGTASLFLTDDTLPTGDSDVLSREMSVRGELYRTMESGFRETTGEDRRTVVEAFRLGLAALDDRDLP